MADQREGADGSEMYETEITLNDFAATLRELQIRSGSPSIRQLEIAMRAVGRPFARSTIQDTCAGRTMPQWGFVEGFVQACHAFAHAHGEPDLATWQARHLRMLRGVAAQRRGQRRTSIAEALVTDQTTRERWPRILGRLPQRAGYFQRRELLIAIASAWGSHVRPSAVVLSGMGGVGKTQAAAEHARLTIDRGEADLVVWITASSEDELYYDYALAASEILGADPRDTRRSARRFLSWLRHTERRWLVILDDLRSPADLNDLWPPSTAWGRTLVTTRRRDEAISRQGRLLVVADAFSAAEAKRYLEASLAGHPRLADNISSLLAALHRLPLALAHASTFMLDRDISCNEYLQRFAETRSTLADLSPEPEAIPDQYRSTIAATWSISINGANELSPRGFAQPLLAVASMLDPNGIPDEIFGTAAVQSLIANYNSGALAASPSNIRDGLHCLARFNLIILEAGMVHIHGLVQRAVYETYGNTERQTLASAAGQALVEAWDSVRGNAAREVELRRNAEALRDKAEEELWLGGSHVVLTRAGRSLGELGNPTGAAEYFERLYQSALRYLGPDAPQSLICRGSIARWRGVSGDTRRACSALESLLVDRIRLLGEDHIKTLATRGSLAHWTGRSGSPKRAIEILESLVADRVRLQGADHPSTLTARRNLIRWRAKDEDPAATVRELRDLLDDRLRIHGPDHPATLIVRGDLATYMGRSGDVESAIVALEELLADRRRLLGEEHPRTLTTWNNLAYWVGKARGPSAALPVLEDLLKHRLGVLGAEHPHTLATMGNIAFWLGEAGDRSAASRALRALMRRRLRVLGPDHEDTIKTRTRLEEDQLQGDTG